MRSKPFLFIALYSLLGFPSNGVHAVDTIDGARHYPSGISRTLAAGVEVAELYVLVVVLAWYAYRAGSAAFHSQYVGRLGVEASHLLSEVAKTLLQCFYHKVWQQLV